jgi:hypothetical protein
MDIQNINVPDLIKINQYNKYANSIKNYEDTLQKLLSNNKNTDITNNPTNYLWKLDNDMFSGLQDNIKEICKKTLEFNYEQAIENIIITGPFVRSCIINNENNKNIEIIKELYFYKCCDDKWDTFINLENFIDEKNEYICENETIKIYLIKKKYKHPSHVILQHGYIKRIGYYNENFYGSSMFLIEIQKHIDLIYSNFSDPILNIPYDPLSVYVSKEKNKLHPMKIIEMVDSEEFMKLSDKAINKLYSNKSCLELCLDKFMSEDHSVMLSQLTQMIIYICSSKTLKQQKRPIILYAQLINLNKKNEELYNYLTRLDNYYNIETNINIQIKSIDDINNYVFDFIIKNDNFNHFDEFLSYTKTKITKNILNMIIKHNANNIAEHIIHPSRHLDKQLDKHLIYYLILMLENFELTKIIDFELTTDILMNYIKDILTNCKIRTFYYMYEKDNTIINYIDDDGKNLLHLIEQKGNYQDLTELIIKLEPNLLDLRDFNKETPIMYHSKHNPEIVKIILNYDFDYTLSDINGNTFLHFLCQYDYPDILKLALKRCPELINMPNKKLETPLIITSQCNKEQMFYVLKSMGADMKTQDLFGNSVFHYICANTMCLGMCIDNNINYFGLKPFDYCKVSTKYYTFI